jgi:AAA family ATP:ADP antiporter
MGKLSRDSLFLDRFESDQLPYVYLANAVLVSIVIAVYLRVAGQVKLERLLIGSLLIFVAMALFSWWGLLWFRSDWLFPAIYVWVGVFGALTIAQLWTLANFMLTTRQAKRIFGLVGSGGITGGIFGALLGNILPARLGTESLFIAIALFLGISAILVTVAWRWRWTEGTEASDASTASEVRIQTPEESPGSLVESFRIVRNSSHLGSIATLICITAIVTELAKWQFITIAKETYVDTDSLTSFLGLFYLSVNGLTLIAQLILTSRILQRFGVGITLFVLPFTLAFGSVGVLVSGGMVAATFLRGSDNVIRYSLDSAALQLLYLPVPSRIKVQVKSFIDVVVFRVGEAMAALFILLFVTTLGFDTQHVGWLSLVCLVMWAIVARQAGQEYLRTLGDGLQQHKIDTERATAPVLDKSTTSVMAEKLESSDANEILYGLRLFEMGYHEAAHPAMRGLIHHESPEVRAKALSILGAAGDTTISADVEGLLDDADLGVRTEALGYLTLHGQIDPLERIGDVGDFSNSTIRSSVVAFLAREGKAQNLEVARMMLNKMLDEDGSSGARLRAEAVKIVGRMPAAFPAEIARLIPDRDPEIARYAIDAAGEVRKRQFVPDLLACLGHPVCEVPATKALARYGNQILGTLDDYLKDPDTPLEVRREIPNVLVEIGTRGAQQVLVENLFQGDATVRFRLLSGLNQFQQTHPDIVVDDQLIETVLAAEIIGHYRSYQALGALDSELEDMDPALDALRESMDREVERIFRLLKVLFAQHDIHAAHVALLSDQQRVRDDSIEFLESLLRPELRSLLLPLVDHGVTVRERIALARRFVGTEVSSAGEAVKMLIHSGDPWLKSCAAYTIGAMGLQSMKADLESLAIDADPLLLETIRQARRQLSDRGEQ